MQAATTIFFDFLKALKFNGLRDFIPFLAKKKLRARQKNAPQKTDGESHPDGAYPRPVPVHPKLEKSRVKFFKRQKKLKTDRASEKKQEQWLH